MDIDRVNELGFENTPKWHSVVLVVAFNRWWNIFIGIQCFVTFVMSTYVFAYRKFSPQMTILRFMIDICYIFEIVCTIVYRVYPRVRKLKYVKTRGWFFIFIDIISVIPFDLLYVCHGFFEDPNLLIEVLSIQNRALRIYRIVLLESFYETLVRKPYHYALIYVFQCTFRLVALSHLLNCIWVRVEKSIECDAQKFNCMIWHELHMIELVMLNWAGKMGTFRRPSERIIVTVGMLLGFFLVFSYLYPKIFYFSMQLYNRRALYYEEFGKLQVFFRNMVPDSKLKAKILHRFNDVWSKGRVDSDLTPLFKNIPLALQKEISTDIYWESLRHSGLLRDVSRSCKRSLTLLMTTEYYHPEEVIYYRGEEKLKMIYLVQGTLQIMAEENEEFPVVSFSSGTVFGEMSLFFNVTSSTILKCSAYCELQILTLQGLMSVLKDYPKDKKLIFHNVHERLSMAKYTQWRKQKFIMEQKLEMLFMENTAIEDCIKWLKKQWRSIWETHKRHLKVLKAKEEGLRLHSWRSFLKTDIKIEFVSNYLDLVVLSDLIENKKDVVCFRSDFPWSVDPSTQFLRIWYYVVLATSLVPALLYPVCTAWTLHFPRKVYHMSFVVTLIFIVDVFLKLFTAIKTKHNIITNFPAVLRHRLQDPTFYFDVVAALPYQLILYFTVDVGVAQSYKIGLWLHPAILKSYVLLILKVPLGDFMDKITVFKNSLIYLLLLYWTAEAIQLIGIRGLANVSTDWIRRFMAQRQDDEKLEKYYMSAINALVTALSIPDFLMYSDDTIIFVCSTITKYFFFLFMSFFLNQLYGTFTVKIYGIETFQVLISRISKFLEGMDVSEQMTDRLLKSLKFQWNYDKADYLSSKMSIIKAIPLSLRKQVYSRTTYKTLLACPMFQEESVEFLLELIEKSYLVAVPRGSVLVTYGHTSHLISIIHRGYCQVNSFLKKDVSSEIGRAIQIGPGYIFPLMSSICSIPSPVSVVTVTDCEVIMLQLNDLLGIMFKHGYFKDLMNVLAGFHFEKNLSDVEPGLLKVDLNKPPGEEDKEVQRRAFEQMGLFWKLLYSCCPRKSIFKRKFFRYWDSFYTLYLIMLVWLWPCCFGLFLKSSHILVPVLTGGKFLTVLHLIFRFYLSYFNKKGLLVTHPVYTGLNYLGSSFVLDVIRSFPVYQIYLYGFADPQKKPHVAAVLALYVQLFFNMNYVMGFLNDLVYFLKSSYFIRMLKITLALLLTFNCFINLMMFINTKWIFSGPYRVVAFKGLPHRFPKDSQLLEDNSLWDYYIFTAHWMLCCLTTNDYLLHEASGLQLYLAYFQAFVGTIGDYFLCVWVASNSIFGNIWGTIYQEKVFSFINYLKYEKADYGLIKYANSHYNYEWSQTHGESLKGLCQHLPLHLHEELVYPIYRPTFSKNKIFTNADEGFFKILATEVKSVFFHRGSVIIFQDEVQPNIYFVHKGKCFVYDWFLVLDKGSIIGDIRQTGVMRNKVYALTHVEMLRISSEDFFNILNNFYDLEANFLYRVKNSESFVQSDVWRSSHQLRPVDSRDVLKAFYLKKKDVGFEGESVFEDPENATVHVFKKLKYSHRKKYMWIIYPGTWKMHVYTGLHVTVIIFTLLSLPIFVSFGGLTTTAFAVIGVTDFLWLMIIILTFRVGITDSQKGDVITDFKLIAKNYATRVNGLLMDTLSLIPFELIPVGLAGGIKTANGDHVAWARMFRLVRGHCFYKLLKGEADILNNNIYLKHFYLISFVIVILFHSVAIYTIIATEPSIVAARNHHELKREQFFAFVLAFEYVINFVSSANLAVIIPNTRGQLHFFNIHAVVYVYLKSVLISRILSLLYVNGVATAYFKSQMLQLESYLSEKETSPSIIKEVLTYRTNLLLLNRSENMPSLLKKAPMTMQIMVMRDLYVQHLVNCPLFKDLESVFLDQLVARASREFYFPGQKILEQGDVDHRMYFIHSGEVYLMNQTKDRAYVEYVVRIIKAGESFGEVQGLWLSIPHPYTYRARTVVDMLVIHSENWVDLRRSFPNIVRKIFDKAKSLRYI